MSVLQLAVVMDAHRGLRSEENDGDDADDDEGLTVLKVAHFSS